MLKQYRQHENSYLFSHFSKGALWLQDFDEGTLYSTDLIFKSYKAIVEHKAGNLCSSHHMKLWSENQNSFGS